MGGAFQARMGGGMSCGLGPALTMGGVTRGGVMGGAFQARMGGGMGGGLGAALTMGGGLGPSLGGGPAQLGGALNAIAPLKSLILSMCRNVVRAFATVTSGKTSMKAARYARGNQGGGFCLGETFAWSCASARRSSCDCASGTGGGFSQQSWPHKPSRQHALMPQHAK